MKAFLVSACVAATLALHPSSARCVILELPAQQDTYASNTNNDSNVNYGTSTGLGLAENRWGGDWAQQVFIQLDLSSIPSGATIDNAEMSLYLGYHDPAGPTWAYIHRVTEPWLEGTGGTYPDPGASYDPNTPVTWNNRPANDGVDWSSLWLQEYPGWGMANEWKTWDVTDLVSAWHQGNYLNYGLVMTMWPEWNWSGHGYVFTSSEGSYGGPPKLTVTYTAGVVPAPSSFFLWGLGLACVAVCSWPRRKTSC